MKRLLKIPYLPGWLTALFFGLLALIPTYAYVRLIPTVIAALIVAYLLLALLGRRTPRLARWLRIGLTSVVIVVGGMVSVTGCLILGGSMPQEPNCDYIVVLGAQVRNSGPSASLWERIDCAYEYLLSHPDTVAVVSGGQGDDEPMSEAQAMYDALTQKGIDGSRIWMEDKATSTWENLKFSTELIVDRTGQQPKSLGVVSSEYHLFRTNMQAKDRGLTLQSIPAKTTDPVRWLHYFVREIAGVWHYLILGGLYA